MSSTEYRIYCVTEQKFKTVWGADPPQVCPTDASHNVLAGSVSDVRKKHNKILIAKSGISDYKSIGEALVANNNQINTVFEIYPGTYIEMNPLTLPQGCVLLSVGTPGNVTIVGVNPAAPVFVMSNWTKLYGISIVGTGVLGSKGIYYNGGTGSNALYDIEDCIITNCDIGIEVDGGIHNTFLIRTCLAATMTAPMSKALYVHNGGQVIGTSYLVAGSMDNSGNMIPFIYGVYCEDNYSKVSLTTTATYLCQYGFFCDNGAELEITLVTIGFCVYAITVGQNSTISKLRLNSLNIKDSILYDINVLPQDADIIIYCGVIDETKVYNPNNVAINAKFQYAHYKDKYMTFTGNIKFGSNINPTTVSMGQGRYSSGPIYVYSNTFLESGTWTDNTAAAIEDDTLTFSPFTDNSGSCLYIGSSVSMYGIQASVTTPVNADVSLNSVAWEYWNGSTWVGFNIMQSSINTPYYCYVDKSFISIHDTVNIRFGITSITPFATKSINGITTNWIRCRLVNSIVSTPVIDGIKIHVSQTQINKDGFVEYFGDARPCGKILLKLSDFTSNVDNSIELFRSKTFSVIRKNLLFAANTLTKIGTFITLPTDIDLSFPIKLNIVYMTPSDSSGNVGLHLHYDYTSDNSVIYDSSGAAPDIPDSNVYKDDIVNISISPNSSYKELRSSLAIDVNHANINPRPGVGSESIVWLNILREADVTDTFPGNFCIINIYGTYVRWSSGTHINSY